MARLSDASVVGVFNRYGVAYWDSPNGERPDQSELDSGHARILTPVTIGDVVELKGDAQMVSLAAVVGGRVGCDTMTQSPNLPLGANGRYAFFFIGVVNESGSAGARLIEAWPIAGDIVTSPLDGSVTIEELRSDLNGDLSEPAPAPSASPGEPSASKLPGYRGPSTGRRAGPPMNGC